MTKAAAILKCAAKRVYQCGPQPRNTKRRIIVPMTEIKRDPRHPNRFEKKAKIQASFGLEAVKKLTNVTI
jgi:hypothetical protein